MQVKSTLYMMAVHLSECFAGLDSLRMVMCRQGMLCTVKEISNSYISLDCANAHL